MPAVSAGIVLYRWRPGMAGGRPAEPQLEVLLVHPGGPYWANRESAAWSIPKGQAEPHELVAPPSPAEPWQRPARAKPRLSAASADLLRVAKREFREETGFEPDELAAPGAAYLPLGGIKQRGHKIVYAWALEGDCDAGAIVSETFAMEWPPHSGRMQVFPEVDRAAWFTLPAAREALVAGQRRFLDELEVVVGSPRRAESRSPAAGVAEAGGES